MIRSCWTQWIAPWRWAPLIFILTLQGHLSDSISIAGHYLIIPIGAHLTRRYGRAGFIVLILSGLPLLGRVSFDAFGTAPGLDVYLSALLISWWLPTYPSTLNNIPQIVLKPWVVIGFFILPLSVGLGSYDILWLDNVNWLIEGYSLFFLLVFMLGFSRMALQPVLITLTFAAFSGLILEYFSFPANAGEWLQANRAELPWFGLTDLRSLFISYRFDSPAALFTAYGFLFFGRFLADQHNRPTQSLPSLTHRNLMIFTVFFLAFGGQINASLLPGDNPALHWFGNFYAILLLAMLTGFHLRFAGILSLLLLVTGFWWIDAVLRADLNLIKPHFYFRLDHLLYIYGFGLLGIGIRDALEQTSTRLWSGEWFRFLVFYFLVLISVIQLNAPYDILIITLSFFSGIAFVLFLNRLREHLAKTEISLKGGWLSIASIIMMGYLVYNFSKSAWPGLQDAFQQTIGMVKQLLLAKKALNEEDLMMGGVVTGAVVIGLWTVTSTFKGFLKAAHQLFADLRVIFERMHNKVPIILKFRRRNKTSASGYSGKTTSCLLGILTWTNRVLFTALILIFFTVIGYNTWIRYQKDLEYNRRHSTKSAPISKKTLQKQTEQDKARADLVNSLTHATQVVLKDYPNLNVNHSDYQTTITSDWYIKPAEPQIRRRVSITITPTIRFSEKSPQNALSGSLIVNLHRQDKGRFNLWLEHSPTSQWMQEQELEKEIEQKIVTTAIVESQMNN